MASLSPLLWLILLFLDPEDKIAFGLSEHAGAIIFVPVYVCV
jgi:hypothetical protein